MAFKRQNLSFLQREEELRKKELRQRKAAERQQIREEKMKEKVKELENLCCVAETILECLKVDLDPHVFTEFTEEQSTVCHNTLKVMCSVVADYKYKLFDLTGDVDYLTEVDRLYRGI